MRWIKPDFNTAAYINNTLLPALNICSDCFTGSAAFHIHLRSVAHQKRGLRFNFFTLTDIQENKLTQIMLKEKMILFSISTTHELYNWIRNGPLLKFCCIVMSSQEFPRVL